MPHCTGWRYLNVYISHCTEIMRSQDVTDRHTHRRTQPFIVKDISSYWFYTMFYKTIITILMQFVGVPMALSVLLRGFSPGTAAWLPLTPGPPSWSAWPPRWAGAWGCWGQCQCQWNYVYIWALPKVLWGVRRCQAGDPPSLGLQEEYWLDWQ